MERSKSKRPGGSGDIQKGESFKTQGIFIFDSGIHWKKQDGSKSNPKS